MKSNIDAICSHVVVRSGAPGAYRYAIATDDHNLTVVGPWCRTKSEAWSRGLAALRAA